MGGIVKCQEMVISNLHVFVAWQIIALLKHVFAKFYDTVINNFF